MFLWKVTVLAIASRFISSTAATNRLRGAHGNIFPAGTSNAKRTAHHGHHGSTPSGNSDIFMFNPPLLKHFIHIEGTVARPTNATTLFGTYGKFNNGPGNVTGEITGTIAALGAANELVPVGTDGSHTFLNNQVTINATSPFPGSLVMDVTQINQYANEALFGLANVRIQGPPPSNEASAFYSDLNFQTFVAVFQSAFNTGTGSFDIFRVVPRGRIDGEEIPALLPPGESTAE